MYHHHTLGISFFFLPQPIKRWLYFFFILDVSFLIMIYVFIFFFFFFVFFLVNDFIFLYQFIFFYLSIFVFFFLLSESSYPSYYPFYSVLDQMEILYLSFFFSPKLQFQHISFFTNISLDINIFVNSVSITNNHPY